MDITKSIPKGCNQQKEHFKPNGRLPVDLMKIRDTVRQFEMHAEERAQTASRWAHQSEYLKNVTPQVRASVGGESVYTGELSPGCQACKAGKWDCLFLSMACNLSCKFCLTPCAFSGTSAISAISNNPDELMMRYQQDGIIGIGISGGEPLLNPHWLLQYLSSLRAMCSELYLWVYTNGLLLTKDLISALSETGLNELRFNMAATGYFHAHVTAMLNQAALRLPSVTVEIPAIPEHVGLLRKALPAYSRAGVKYLNLHELIYQPGSPSERMPGARTHCRMPDGHVCEFNPQSMNVTEDVLRDIDSGKLPIAVNYCSLSSKSLQLSGRRRMMAPYSLQAYEYLNEDGEAESICCFNDTNYHFLHPSKLMNTKILPKGLGVAIVKRLLPLTPDGPFQWTDFKILREVGVSCS